jgi:hypothetical protein
MARVRHSVQSGLHLLRTLVGCSVLWVACAPMALAQHTHSEHAVKSAFIYRFTAYVEWPGDCLDPERFTIAVLGDASVAETLQRLTLGRALLNRPVQVRQVTSPAEARNAQVMFIGRNRPADLRRLLAPMASHCALVISDELGGLESGSTVNFLMADNRLRFEVSLPAARRARLKISSEMLSVAARVQQ